MTRRAAIVVLVSLSAIWLVSCSNKSNKNATTVRSPKASEQHPSPQPATVDLTHQASASDVAATQQLYLLSATPADDYSYPATLYRAENGKLEAVREVVPQAEGVRSVQAWGNVIFLIHPAQIPKAVTVLHPDEQLHVDDVEINPNYSDFFVTDEAIAEPKPSVFDELILASKGGFSLPNLEWLSISSGSAAPGPSVKLDSWDEYAAMRLEGEPGGPEHRQASFAVAAVGTNLVFPPAWGHPVVIDSVSPTVLDATNGTASNRALVLAASRQYLLLGVSHTFEELFSSKSLNSSVMDLFLHDRVRDLWKTIQIEGNSSRTRLFGSWLAVTVEMFNPDRKPSPGRENERGPEAFGDYGIAGSKGNDGTARYPFVRGAYPSQTFTPGILVLQNLEDGRKIRIETNQEDSEILSVAGDSVLYRVNDTIYHSKIAGDKLQNPSVIVRDEDVPEIHWVFWGPPAKPATGTQGEARGISPPPPPLTGAPTRIKQGGDVTAASIIEHTPPVYPDLARRARIQGDVVLHAIIDKDGKVAEVQILSGHPLLVQAAIDAARRWRYAPTVLNGNPVEVDTTITVPFALGGQEP